MKISELIQALEYFKETWGDTYIRLSWVSEGLSSKCIYHYYIPKKEPKMRGKFVLEEGDTEHVVMSELPVW